MRLCDCALWMCASFPPPHELPDKPSLFQIPRDPDIISWAGLGPGTRVGAILHAWTLYLCLCVHAWFSVGEAGGRATPTSASCLPRVERVRASIKSSCSQKWPLHRQWQQQHRPRKKQGHGPRTTSPQHHHHQAETSHKLLQPQRTASWFALLERHLGCRGGLGEHVDVMQRDYTERLYKEIIERDYTER